MPFAPTAKSLRSMVDARDAFMAELAARLDPVGPIEVLCYADMYEDAYVFRIFAGPIRRHGAVTLVRVAPWKLMHSRSFAETLDELELRFRHVEAFWRWTAAMR